MSNKKKSLSETFSIKKKNCIESLSDRSCYDLKIRIGDAFAAFSTKIPKKRNKRLIAKTWDDRTVYFLGLISPQQLGNINYVANCPCIIEKFISREFWDFGWLSQFQQWHTCYSKKCISVSCDNCFNKNKTAKKNERYKCPFPCAKGKYMCSALDDAKEREEMRKEAEADSRHCARCNITRLEFMEKNPTAKLLTWTSVPNTIDQV